MEQINIKIRGKDKEYSVYIGSSASALIYKFLKDNHKGKRIVVITDTNVKDICKTSIMEPIKALGPGLIPIPAGESSKSRETKERVEDTLLEKKYGRDTVIIAVGGGVIGDLAGFIASTYNRGIPLIHVPTTLLAMVDSSIGGKTAINTKHGKNLIGTTYQPDAVFTDLSFLETLPDDEFANGMAEIIKIAATSDKALFNYIKKNAEKINGKDKEAMLHIIKRSIELKKKVVEKDEKEAGLRQILNFGHTFAHALEAYSEYNTKHGYCVSQGIAVEAKISVLLGDLKNNEEEQILLLLKAFGLPDKVIKEANADKIIEIMESDKKTRNQKPRFVILKRIGEIKADSANFSFEVDGEIIKKSIELCKND